MYVNKLIVIGILLISVGSVSAYSLTIQVTNETECTVLNSVVRLEGYGSLYTYDMCDATFTDIPNGNYRYKAYKDGYIGYGWADTTISGASDTVTYTLTTDTSPQPTPAQQEKVNDEHVKSVFLPMIYLLSTFIVVGGLMYLVFK